MTIYTSLALVIGILVGSTFSFLLFRTLNKMKLKNAKIGGAAINTLKSEGVDQPKKETELIQGKEVAQTQPAVSPNVPPIVTPIEPVVEPITQIEEEIEELSEVVDEEEEAKLSLIADDEEQIRLDAEEKIKKLREDKLKSKITEEEDFLKKLKKKKLALMRKIRKMEK